MEAQAQAQALFLFLLLLLLLLLLQNQVYWLCSLQMQSAKNDIERWLYRKNGRREYGMCLFVLVRARVVVQARKRIRNKI